MKKLLSFVFVIVLLLSITACKNSQLSTRIAEPFSKILKNEQAFYTSYSKTNITLSDYNKTVWQYSLVDMDADGNDVADGEVGEIVVNVKDGAPCGLFRGYYNDEAKTKEVWYDGYYHTGDTAWRDEDGYFW